MFPIFRKNKSLIRNFSIFPFLYISWQFPISAAQSNLQARPRGFFLEADYLVLPESFLKNKTSLKKHALQSCYTEV